jgi:hypothetical protein
MVALTKTSELTGLPERELRFCPKEYLKLTFQVVSKMAKDGELRESTGMRCRWDLKRQMRMFYFCLTAVLRPDQSILLSQKT